VLIRFLENCVTPNSVPWQHLLGVIAMATMLVSNFSALNQSNVKRLFAYSSISHIGFILMTLSVGSYEAVKVVVFYSILYALMNLVGFTVIEAVKDFRGEMLENYRGLYKKNPTISIAFAITLLSLAGLPPLCGFVAKFFLLFPVIAQGHLWYYALAVIAVFSSVLSLYYYSKIIRAMFFEEEICGDDEKSVISQSFSIVAAIFAVFIVVLGVYFYPLLSWLEL
jgi:NADH-quinone oxidoreductase subunit N